MVSLPRKSGTALALALGVLLVVTGFSAPAEAAIARSISVSATPSTVAVRAPVTYSGTLSRSPIGSTVRIQRKSGSTWVLARTTTTTTAGGKYSVRLNAPATGGSYRFRAFAPAAGTRAAAISAPITVTALNRTTATLTATPATIAPGQASVLSGTVSPRVAGTALTVQRYTGSAWVNDTVTQVSAAGTYSKAVSPSATTIYRVQVPRAGFNGAVTTASRSVTVVPLGEAPTITTSSLPDGAKGVAYNATLEKTGGAGTWTRSAGTLPAGLSLAPGTGAITGTPTSAGTSNFTVTFTETSTGLTANKSLSITVTPPPTITTTSLPDATRGTAYSVALTKTGQAGTWSIYPGSELPDGLTLNPTTGVLSGVPAAATGLYAVYPVFTETATGLATFKPLGLTVTGADVAITTPTLPDGTKGQPYSVALTKTGLPGTWSPFGDLPAGLSLDPETGVLAGTPSVSGLFSVYVVYTETATGAFATKGFALTIAKSPVITTTSVPDGTTGSPYSQQLVATGNAGTWEVTAGQLPAGVTVSASGLLAGTPTVAGDYGFTVTFTETSTGYTDKQALLLHVSDPGAPVITTTTLPDGTVGSPYSGQLEAVGTGTWTVSYGSLPPGLSLNTGSGAITGTPTAGSQGDYLFQVQFTSGGKSNTKVLLIHIDPAPTP